MIVAAFFLRLYGCLYAASDRSHLMSEMMFCPGFVDIELSDLEKKFNLEVKKGDSTEKIEAALNKLNINFSWDKYSGRYHGIIRHPNTNFHAIVVYIYLDRSNGFSKIDIHDSFTG